ncbi:MAG: methyltransferase domain-containing protein [Phycisphaerales bacterium]|nr:methyltransferase domain-containing protein [Phycisphaerales bacterium]
MPALAALRPGQALGWHAYAEGWLNFPLGRVLDYGCSTGVFIQRIVNRCDECHAVDVDPASVAEAAKIKGVRAFTLPPATTAAPAPRLPFPDAYFDTVLIIEVIEHVSDERAILRELARVLKPGGKLLLTTPHKGLLTWLDPANLKFVFPRLHRFIYKTVLRRGEYYETRFCAKRQEETGLIGSVAAGENPWHRHCHRAGQRARFSEPRP